MGHLLQGLLSPLFARVRPAVESLWSDGETGYHSLAAAVVKQRYRREAMASAFRILGEGQLGLTKFLLITDRAVDLRDFPRTLEHVLELTFRTLVSIHPELVDPEVPYWAIDPSPTRHLAHSLVRAASQLEAQIEEYLAALEHVRQTDLERREDDLPF